MEELARSAFYVTDIAAGRIGSFKIEEEGWGQGDGARAYQEIREALAFLEEKGFERDTKGALRAPYSHNIRRTLLKKKFKHGTIWVTVVLAERFGVDAAFTSHDECPW
jgi:hypothetical protein